MIYYANPYTNYFVHLLKTEFKGQPASQVAKQAGRRWSSMAESEKECYYRMAKKGREAKKTETAMKTIKKEANRKTRKNEARTIPLSGVSSMENVSSTDSDLPCSWVCEEGQKRVMPDRPPTPRPGYAFRPVLSSQKRLYNMNATLKSDKTPKRIPDKASVKRRLLCDSDSEETGRHSKKIKKEKRDETEAEKKKRAGKK